MPVYNFKTIQPVPTAKVRRVQASAVGTVG